MMRKRDIHGNERGVSAVEFGLALPMLLSFVIGTAQMGKLFYANADMRHAVAAGARLASVFPVPDDALILARVNEKLSRTNSGGSTSASIVHSDADEDNPWLEIRMTYTVPLDFIFFTVGPVTLTESRRVFTQVGEEAEEEEEAEEGGGTSTGSTGGTSSDGGTTSSTSSTSTSSGDPSSTSSSWGGTTSSTGGTTTTSSTTSASTSSTSSSSGNNGSSGNSNGGGHGHGNCKDGC